MSKQQRNHSRFVLHQLITNIKKKSSNQGTPCYRLHASPWVCFNLSDEPSCFCTKSLLKLCTKRPSLVSSNKNLFCYMVWSDLGQLGSFFFFFQKIELPPKYPTPQPRREEYQVWTQLLLQLLYFTWTPLIAMSYWRWKKIWRDWTLFLFLYITKTCSLNRGG